MWSIALFPCSYTDGARIIGELSYSLGLQVYTDEVLFSELSERFGVPIEKAAGLIYGKTPSLHLNTLKKEKYIHLLRCTLMTLRMLSPRRRMFYGLHTSLLDPRIHRVLKVLVIDDDESRVRRAMQQEKLSEEVARDSIRKHDEKAFTWTQLLLQKDAYDRSLYDVVIRCENKEFFDITSQVIQHYQSVSRSPTQPLMHAPPVHSSTSLHQIIELQTEPEKTPVSL